MKRPETIRIIRETDSRGETGKYYESLFFQGNGRFGFRGFREECPGGEGEERTIFAAGFFGELKPGITDMVNCPDFLYTRLESEGEAVTSLSPRADGSHRELDLDTGILSGGYTWSGSDGARLEVTSFRFPSLADRRLAVHSLGFYSPDRDMILRLTAGIDGTTRNRPVHDDQLKQNDDLVCLRETTRRETNQEDLLCFGALAAGTGLALEVATAFAFSGESAVSVTETDGDLLVRHFTITIPRGEYRRFDRITALATSRDPFGCSAGAGLAEAVAGAAREAAARGSEALRGEHEAAWAALWDVMDLGVEGNDSLTLGLRYSVFQLVQSAAMDDPGVSIGARGLSHSRYKGSYFWDTDVFMLPFYAHTLPQAASALLEYRYRNLPGARSLAKAQGLKGARYPWMAGFDGKEQCDTWDIGLSEVHVTADVAWAVNVCRRWMDNEDWFFPRGLEILIETARYWESRFTRDEETGAWNLLWVKGPDEYGGVTINNYFTVAMARENLLSAVSGAMEFEKRDPGGWKALKNRLGFDSEEPVRWKALAEHCVLPLDKERSLPLEDGLFLKKEPFDFSALKKGDEPLYKTVPFDRLQRLRVIKQADLVLLGRLLPGIFSPREERAVWDFYEPLTVHDSTLSFGVHAEAAAVLGLPEEAEDYLFRSARLDLDDRMKNVAGEGLHLAACGGTWRALVLGFAGLDCCSPSPVLSPVLPRGWEGYHFRFTRGGERYCGRVNRRGWSVHDASDTLVASGSLNKGEAGI